MFDQINAALVSRRDFQKHFLKNLNYFKLFTSSIYIYIYIYILYIYTGVSKKKLNIVKYFLCNLFQKVKLSYILDSLQKKELTAHESQKYSTSKYQNIYI